MNVTIDELWAAANIADFTGLSKKTVQNHYVCRPGFPKALMTPRGRRWIREEVQAWWDANTKRGA